MFHHILSSYISNKKLFLINVPSCQPWLSYIAKVVECTLLARSLHLNLPMDYSTVFQHVNQIFNRKFGSKTLKDELCAPSISSSVRSENSTVMSLGPRVFGMTTNQRDVVKNVPERRRKHYTNHQDQVSETVSQAEISINDNLFNMNESQIAQRRDELAAGQPVLPAKSRSRVVKATPKIMPPPTPTVNGSTIRRGRPKKIPVPAIKPLSEETPLSTTTVTQEAKAFSRSGRPIKSPLTLWRKVDESVMVSVRDNKTNTETGTVKKRGKKEVDLNESIVLRNNKVLGKKKTPPLKNSTVLKITPLSTVVENENLPKAKKVPVKPKTSRKKMDKENSMENQKSPKKQTKKKVSLTKEKTDTASKKENPAKTDEKKKVNKRKSPKNMLDCPSSKKKKCEDSDVGNLAEIDSDEDLFGSSINYKKTTTPFIQNVLSPTSGMLSAKKAAAAVVGKETPPCKTLGQLMSQSGISCTSSVGREAPVPKPAHVVKRVVKMVKAVAANPPKVKKTTKPATKINSSTPLATATFISTMLSNNKESDEDSDFDDDDDDDDLA